VCTGLYTQHSSLLFLQMLVTLFKEKGGKVNELGCSEEEAADINLTISYLVV